MPIYNQRWLREHKAVPTEEGWRRPTNGELLKCQKNINVDPPQPILKRVTYKNLTKIVVVEPDGTGSFTFDYEIDEPDYKPELFKVIMEQDDFLKDYVVDEVNKKVTVNIHNVTVDGDVSRVYFIADGMAAYYDLGEEEPRDLPVEVFFSINYPNPKIHKVNVIGDQNPLMRIFEKNNNTGSSYFKYRVFDTIEQYSKEDVEVELIDYDGESDLILEVTSANEIRNFVHVYSNDGKAKAGETFKVSLKVKGVSVTKPPLFTIIQVIG